MKIVSAAEMRQIDRITTEKYGVPSLTLMENAGSAVAEFIQRYYATEEKITVVCGKGNNGGDGFVTARKLLEAGKQVSIVLAGRSDDVKGDAKVMLNRVAARPGVIPLQASRDGATNAILQARIVVDALLGTGFKPPLSGLYAEAVALINGSQAVVVALDVPSGADSDSREVVQKNACRADAVVTFTAPKPAHVFSDLTRGPIVVAPIGSPHDAIDSDLNLSWCGDGCRLLHEHRAPDANKGRFGHVLIVAGSVGKAGAAAMAAMGAMRSGAGLTTAAVPRSVINTVAGFAPELMTEPLAETEAGTISRHVLDPGALDALLERKTVVALGPGLSRHAETAEFAREFVRRCELPLVIDADGLNAFDGHTEELNGAGRSLVLTPHPGEMARLVGNSVAQIEKDRIAVARAFARRHACILVLKGRRTLVVDPNGATYVNTTGNAGMAKGGTGDVLTGMIAAMLAQFPTSPVEAVCAAVHLHGLAADFGVDRSDERSLLASEIAAAIPRALDITMRPANLFTFLRGWCR